MSAGEFFYVLLMLAVGWWAADMLGVWDALQRWIERDDQDPPEGGTVA